MVSVGLRVHVHMMLLTDVLCAVDVGVNQKHDNLIRLYKDV